MVELRKTKELNDRLDLEIRALRNRVRFLDAEKNSLQQTVRYLLKEVFYHINPMVREHCIQDPSIHPSSAAYLESGCGCSCFSSEPQTPFPWPRMLNLTGESQALSGQRGDVIPPPGPGSTPRSPPSWSCQEHLPRKASWWPPHQIPKSP